MYLNSRRRPTRRRGISLRRLALWIFAPILIFIGIGIYQNREMFIPTINQFMNNVVDQAGAAVATIQAPTPSPTADPQDRVIRAQASWEQGNYQEAVNLYEDVIGALPNDLNAHYFLTLGYLIEGRDQEAMIAAENTVTANPFSSDAWAIRALALNRAGRYGESIASALRALEINSDSARAHVFLAESLFDSGLIERGEAEISLALELDPNSFEAYYVRARINAESKYDFEAAKEDLRIAYDLSDGMTYIGIALAQEELLREGGDEEAGLALLNEMNERNPNNPPILAMLGRYYRSTGSRDQAATYLTRCVSAVPTASICHFWLGRVQYDDGDQPELAAASFEKAVELGTTNPQYYYWAASSQIDAMGNCTAGAQYLEEGYELAKQTGLYVADFEEYMRSTSCAVFDLPTLTPVPTEAESDITPEV
jgi:tetratricopeptide (TPR) repeat protein